MLAEAMDIISIGHIARDRNVVGHRSEVATGGGVYFGGMVFLALGFHVAIVTRLARADEQLLDDLKEAGATVLPTYATETSGIENVHAKPNSDKRVCHPLGFAGSFRPEEVPDVPTQLYHISSIMPGEVDLPFLREVASRGPIALDVQGLLRKRVGDELITDGWPEAEEGLSLVRYLKVDDREAEALTGEQDHRRATELLAEMGPEEVVLTHKEGVLVRAGAKLSEAPFRPRSLAGRTGRGDSCFSAYLGRRLLGDSPKEATRFAAALTTLKLERPGPFQRPLADVEALLEGVGW